MTLPSFAHIIYIPAALLLGTVIGKEKYS